MAKVIWKPKVKETQDYIFSHFIIETDKLLEKVCEGHLVQYPNYHVSKKSRPIVDIVGNKIIIKMKKEKIKDGRPE